MEAIPHNAPRGNDWNEIVEALHAISNMVTTRSHYEEGHPAILRADDVGSKTFRELLERLPEIVVALIDGEFVICERPLPELRARLNVLARSMERHEIQCLVFQRGLTPPECVLLGQSLAKDGTERVRESVQADLPHILVRFAAFRKNIEGTAAGTSALHFVPLVVDTLASTAKALSLGEAIDIDGIKSLARSILDSCSLKTFSLTQRCWTRSPVEAATHATNVAMVAGAMALEAQLPDAVCVDVTAAALIHDIGQLLLSEEIAGLAEPMLDERAKPVFRNHTFAGASVLLAAGAPPLWIAAALEHHRGIDGAGYPVLESPAPPHELVRMIALANFFDKKRTLLDGKVDSPDDVIQQARALEDRYFGRSVVERFVRAVGVYPPGTTVELSDRQPALVLAANGTDPRRPRVLLLRGPNAGKQIDLREWDSAKDRHRCSIVGAIAPPLFVLSDIEGAADISPPAPVVEKTNSFLDGLLQQQKLGASIPPVPSRPPSDDQPSEEALLAAIGSLAKVPVVTGAPNGVDHRGGFILTFVDGMSTVEDIIDVSGLPRREVLRILRDLVALSVVTLR
jgi:hypothetical protein